MKASKKDKLLDAMTKEFVKVHPIRAAEETLYALNEIEDYGTVAKILREYEKNEDVNEGNIFNYLLMAKRAKDKHDMTSQLEKYAQRFCEMWTDHMERLNTKDEEHSPKGTAEDCKAIVMAYYAAEHFADDMPAGTFDEVRRAFDEYLFRRRDLSDKRLKGASVYFEEKGKTADLLVAGKTYDINIIMPEQKIMEFAVVTMGFPIQTPIKGLDVVNEPAWNRRNDGLARFERVFGPPRVNPIFEEVVNPIPRHFHVLNFSGEPSFHGRDYANCICVNKFKVDDERLLEYRPFIYKIYTALPGGD